jgi:hypothetical protein
MNHLEKLLRSFNRDTARAIFCFTAETRFYSGNKTGAAYQRRYIINRKSKKNDKTGRSRPPERAREESPPYPPFSRISLPPPEAGDTFVRFPLRYERRRHAFGPVQAVHKACGQGGVQGVFAFSDFSFQPIKECSFFGKPVFFGLNQSG